MTAFSPCDPSTWPVTLTVEQVAAIYQRQPGGLYRTVLRGRFVPAPYKRSPMRWRKVDVLRDVEGARGLRRAG